MTTASYPVIRSLFFAPGNRPDLVAKFPRFGADCCVIDLEDGTPPEDYGSARNFGHLAFEVDDIYALCAHLQSQGITINRPPRDGRMAFVRSPDGISIELLQAGPALPPAEPWASMPNVGSW